MWLCPACHKTLYHHETTLSCDNGHCYDKAKEGYVNLLLAQHKNSKAPGDNKVMIGARRQFLEAGHYHSMVKNAFRLLASQQVEDQLSLFDAGCGEGYYLGQLGMLAEANGLSFCAAGIDVSKPGIQKAAKKYPQYEFAVASTFAIPRPDKSCTAVLQIFAPSKPEEVWRILMDDGVWLQVNPAAGHLQELQSLLYDRVKPHRNDASIPKGFELVTEETLKVALHLSEPEHRSALLMMTPYYWSASDQQKHLVSQNLTMATAEFNLRLLRKTAG